MYLFPSSFVTLKSVHWYNSLCTSCLTVSFVILISAFCPWFFFVLPFFLQNHSVSFLVFLTYLYIGLFYIINVLSGFFFWHSSTSVGFVFVTFVLSLLFMYFFYCCLLPNSLFTTLSVFLIPIFSSHFSLICTLSSYLFSRCHLILIPPEMTTNESKLCRVTIAVTSSSLFCSCYLNYCASKVIGLTSGIEFPSLLF